jgi:hypothetical protein
MQATKSLRRRNFLLATGLGSAAAVAAAVGSGLRSRAKPDSVAQAREADGYRASPHVMKYYKTTEV